MLIDYASGQTGVILRVKVRQDNSGAKPGQGFVGLSNTSTGLIVSTIADSEPSATAYTAAGSTIDSIATLGTFATPTSGHCRLKQVDPTNHPGLIELQIDNSRYAVSGAKELTVTISGVSGLADCDAKVPLRSVNPYDSQRFGMAALPASGSLAINPTLAASQSFNNSGQLSAMPANATQLAGQTVSAASPITVLASVGTAGTSVAQSGDAFGRLGAPVGASISADIQTRSTFSGGAVASVTAPVTIGAYSAGQDPGTIVWAGSSRTLTGFGFTVNTNAVTLSATGLDSVKGWGSWSARQTIQAIAQVLLGDRSGMPAPGTAGTVTFTGPSSAAYGSISVDTSGNITASNLTPPA